MAQLSESSMPRIARGGWANMPQVIWEDRDEMTFSLSEGVMNDVGMGLLFSAKLLTNASRLVTYVPKREGPFFGSKIRLSAVPSAAKPVFCYEYERDCIQQKVNYSLDGCNLTVEDSSYDKEYIVDYYFEYGKESLLYVIEKERFTGTFTLEGKFYTKDENEGLNVTNVLTMPKVRVVSGINLRLGEGANPTTSVFNVIAMPVKTADSSYTLAEIVRLPEDIDAEI